MTEAVFVPFHEKPKRSDRLNVGWVVMPNGCHEWKGGQNGGGYGQILFKGKKRYIHRLRYEMEVGPIPEGMVMDHFVCNNRACCNPAHVRPVTVRENALRADSISALAASKTHCPRGHALVAGNLLTAQLARGERECRTCANDRQRVRRKPDAK